MTASQGSLGIRGVFSPVWSCQTCGTHCYAIGGTAKNRDQTPSGRHLSRQFPLSRRQSSETSRDVRILCWGASIDPQINMSGRVSPDSSNPRGTVLERSGSLLTTSPSVVTASSRGGLKRTNRSRVGSDLTGGQPWGLRPKSNAEAQRVTTKIGGIRPRRVTNPAESKRPFSPQRTEEPSRGVAEQIEHNAGQQIESITLPRRLRWRWPSRPVRPSVDCGT